MPADISEALRESEQRYRTLFEQSPVGVFLYDRECRITECNARFVEVLSSTFERLVGLDMRSLHDKSVLPAIELALVGRNGVYEGPYAATTSSAHVAISMRTSPLRDAAGAVVGAMGVVEDITLRANAEEALKRSEARFRALIECAPDAIGVFSPERRIVYANAALAALLGYDGPEELIGQPDTAAIHPDERHALEARKPSILAGATLPAHEYRMMRKDGSVVHAEVLSLPIDYDGRPAVLSFARDLSERKVMQARLLLSDRLVSVGTLAAGVAHEINNPLAYLMANLDMAATRRLPSLQSEARDRGETEMADATAQIIEMLDVAREGAERVRNIVRDLKTFARADDESRGPVDVRRVLDASISIAWNELRHRAKLVKDYGNVPLVDANEARIGQVFLNILLNAAQALEVGGAAESTIRVRTYTSAMGEAVVEVTDDGPGIEPELLGRIFDPFFTTKPIGHGTGLGLWICQGIITSLGGNITVESRRGSGATFRVVLPSNARTHTTGALDSGADASQSRPAMRRGRVLVVDDEAALARTLKAALSDEHDVVACGSGREALALLEVDSAFDVVLCDLMMPNMTGMDLYEALMREHMPIVEKFVFVTGGAFTARAREFLDTVRAPQLEKPFELAKLVEMLRARVGSSAS